VKLHGEPLLPAEASASFISGLFCSGPVDPWKLGSTGLIFFETSRCVKVIGRVRAIPTP
jgi:hypothetical protein